MKFSTMISEYLRRCRARELKIEKDALERFNVSAQIRKVELRPDIGLCDDCGLPNFPQEYMGYGAMVCVSCIDKAKIKHHVKTT